VLKAIYTLEPATYGNLISQRRGATTSFYLFDALGSTTQLANSIGAVTDSYLYDAFGNTLLASGTTSNPFRYVGKLGYYFDLDPSQYYLRARFYKPTNGRFVGRDPISQFVQTPLYLYTRNNPLMYVDPGGLEETFYVCRRTVEMEGSARSCGCQHTDIYGDQSGEVYQGFYGPVVPRGGGLPKGKGWKCSPLTRVNYYPWNLFWNPFGSFAHTLDWGPKKGQSCVNASSSDIRACLLAKPKPPGNPGVFYNCQTDVAEAASGCCLGGFAPLTLKPPILII
jgi:RHS repeat-associated protein